MSSFLDLHVAGDPLLLPNPWDAGSARVLASLGFLALASTSSGYAASLGWADYAVSRDEAIAHAVMLGRATGLPVNADLEDGFGVEPEAVAETVEIARRVGLAGCSVEDSGRGDEPILDAGLARDRVAAAVEAAGPDLVLTARAENLLHGRDDAAGLADTIARLQSFQEVGAPVLYAPGLRTAEQVRAVVSSVDRPVNVLAMAGTPNVAELAELGVARISVGGAFAFAAYAGLAQAATELRDAGTFGFTGASAAGRRLTDAAFAERM